MSIFRDDNEIERLNAEKENYQSQLKQKSMEYDQLENKYIHKNNEMFDYISMAFNGFNHIIETAERSDYGNPEQKIRKIKEQALAMKEYFGNLVSDTPLLKNRTITTNQSNK